MPPKWNQKDTQDWDEKQHGVRSTGKEVNEAWHTARDNAVESGDLQRGSPPGSGGQPSAPSKGK